MTKRFGALSPAMLAAIAGAALGDIEVWFDRAIGAASLNAVFDGQQPLA